MNRRVQNPNGIEAFSPGLARFREGLPWEAAITSHNPEGVEYQMLTKRIQPFQRVFRNGKIVLLESQGFSRFWIFSIEIKP
jgi:hypothetical protein